MSELSPAIKWILGVAGTIVGVSMIGSVGLLFSVMAQVGTMENRMATLEATQVQLIKQIDRTLDALEQD